MIEATRRKQGEARFFYGHLVKERQNFRHDPAAFRYYFSAFIQAARSITWRLGNEEPEKWKEWRPKWERTLSAEDKKLMAFTNKLRTAEVKHRGTDPSVELEEVAFHELLRSEDVLISLAIPTPHGRGRGQHGRRSCGSLGKRGL
jgi:hypothetical protein